MQEKRYELKPRDVLFFRDGRPMDADKTKLKDVRNIGHGAVWPRPDYLYKGVIHALLNETAGVKFGDFPSLKVMGPYPLAEDTLYLPRPLDWDMAIEPCPCTDLPKPLECGFIDRTEGKKKLPSWITMEDFKKYLVSGCNGMFAPSHSDGLLFGTESRIGTTLDAFTGASKRVKGRHASGQYQGEYLRLAKGVSMWCSVETGRIGMAKDAPPAPETPKAFVMGGQGGMVVRHDTDVDLVSQLPPPAVTVDGDVFVRWTLIAPALFRETGWLPGWCRDSRKDPADPKPLGTVMFPDCHGCRLVGACTGKPICFSGWDMETGIKPTVLAVPQGSAYLFRCADKTSAEALVSRLHLRRQSDEGPQGFGIGVCSIVKPDFHN